MRPTPSCPGSPWSWGSTSSRSRRLFGHVVYDVLGAAIVTCGILGLIAVAVHADEVLVAAIAGEVPGVVLLGAAIIGARHASRREPEDQSSVASTDAS